MSGTSRLETLFGSTCFGIVKYLDDGKVVCNEHHGYNLYTNMLNHTRTAMHLAHIAFSSGERLAYKGKCFWLEKQGVMEVYGMIARKEHRMVRKLYNHVKMIARHKGYESIRTITGICHRIQYDGLLDD